MKKNKKKRSVARIFISIFSVLGFLGCTVALLYPVISDRWNKYRDMQLITNYNEKINNLSEDDYTDIINSAKEYNKKLRMKGKETVTDKEYAPDEYYESMLNLTGTGMMGYIEVPCIGVKEPIYHYSTDDILAHGIGHIHGSSLPVGGDSTYSILTGHRGLPNQKFFSDLDQIEVGDNFYVHILNETLAYKVYDIQVIEPTEVEHLKIQDGKDLMTLVTCTPYGVNTHRLLVKGERIEFNQEENVSDGFVTNEEHKEIVDPAIWVFIGFMVFIGLLIVIIVITKTVKYIKKKHNSLVKK